MYDNETPKKTLPVFFQEKKLKFFQVSFVSIIAKINKKYSHQWICIVFFDSSILKWAVVVVVQNANDDNDERWKEIRMSHIYRQIIIIIIIKLAKMNSTQTNKQMMMAIINVHLAHSLTI